VNEAQEARRCGYHAPMLTIRSRQRAALREGRRRRFEDRAVAFVREQWPERWTHLGEVAVRALVEIAEQRAAAYGLDTERDAIRYLNHMLALGRDFDTDPRYPWAGEILQNRGIAPSLRMDWLSARTRHELRRAEEAAR
jgi:hypothetical protein